MKLVHGGDVYRHQVTLDFSANVNPLGTPKAVVQAMQDSVVHCAQYPDVQCSALTTALAKHLDLPPTQILCGNGAADLIFTLTQTVKPRKACIQAPTFAEYEQALRAVGCEITYHRSSKATQFAVSEDLLCQIDDTLDLLFLCNPNNPTGLLIDRSLLQTIVKRCHEHHVILVLDECFQDFVDQPQSMQSQLQQYPNLVILRAFTKLYAMAGVRLGYLMTANRGLIEAMHATTQPWNVSSVAQAGGVSALQQTAYVAQSKTLIKTERTFLSTQLQQLGYTVYPSCANYLFFETEPTLFADCLQAGVLIRDCGNYHGLQAGFYRVAVRTRQENQTLLNTLARIQAERKSP